MKLVVSIVVWHPRLDLLEACLKHLTVAVQLWCERYPKSQAHLALIDNDAGFAHQAIEGLAAAGAKAAGMSFSYHHSQGNVGYGRGHNLALQGLDGDFYLVLNADAELAPDALVQGVSYLQQHSGVELLAPAFVNKRGQTEYLAKRYPKLFDLLLRGFAPAWIKARFANRLAHYEMRAETDAGVAMPVPLCSGACMLLTRRAVASSQGFDTRFFVYFEDFDLSWRLSRTWGAVVYLPAMKVLHHGGGAARKGLRHILLFAHGAWLFYRKHGLK